MTTAERLTLNGCAPTPLASYLKALGVLRLLSSPANHVDGKAADPQARGWWEHERFHLTTTLGPDGLLHYFLEAYAPSPIIAPWNGRAGFLEGDAGAESSRTGAELMNAIQQSGSSRFENMRRTIKSLHNNMALRYYDKSRAIEKTLKKNLKVLEGDEKIQAEERLKGATRQSAEAKSLLLPTLRATTDIDHLTYIDACYILAMDEVAAPLLGSGGNDGSRDFGVNFAERLKELFKFDDGTPKDNTAVQLEAALFAIAQRLASSGSMGQFSPGQGGANATTGYAGYSPLNGWDVVLAMEGTMVFAGALTRRWGATDTDRAAFPFMFEPIGAGAGSLSSADPNRPRGEIWTPLWRKPATFSEIAAVFAEGRLTLRRRAARTGLDAARSIARIGQSRGINGFERYSLIQPDAKMPYQATPLGRFNTPAGPRRDLIEDLEASGWLDNARRLVGSKSAPAHAKSAMRRLEDALFQMTHTNRANDATCSAVMALGGFIGWLVTSSMARESLGPPPRLSPEWIRAAYEDLPEFRVATALAGLGLSSSRKDGVEPPAADDLAQTPEASKAPPPMATHFAPIDENRFFTGQRRAWSKDGSPPSMVWGAGGLVSNMIAVLERRLAETAIRGLDDKPLAGATHARLADVAAFLSGDFDDRRCAELLAGMIWARPTGLPTNKQGDGYALRAAVPYAYAAIKPIFTPDQTLRRLGVLAEIAAIPVPPGLVARLRAGGLDGRATDEAVRAALARARASGLPSPFDPARAGGRDTRGEGSRIGAGLQADRLAAALLIPIGDGATRRLLERAYPGACPEDPTELAEDTNDAA